MGKSKYLLVLQELLKKAQFTAAEARSMGMPTRMLAHFCKQGVIERISRGIYKNKNAQIATDFEWEDLVHVAHSIPQGVICLISALCYYNLTDQIMREFWIAVPNTSKAPRRPNTRIIRMRNIMLGQTEMYIAMQKVKIFDRERTVVDAFRYLGKEIAMKALKCYLHPSDGTKCNLKKLFEYAKLLRVSIEPYVTALLL